MEIHYRRSIMIKRCKHCKVGFAENCHLELTGDKQAWICPDCGNTNPVEDEVVIMELKPDPETLRPDHYKKGEDTFAWAERKFDLEICLAIAAFNIHKYNDRSKGQDYQDFGKVADYALWARSLMEKLGN